MKSNMKIYATKDDPEGDDDMGNLIIHTTKDEAMEFADDGDIVYEFEITATYTLNVTTKRTLAPKETIKKKGAK